MTEYRTVAVYGFVPGSTKCIAPRDFDMILVQANNLARKVPWTTTVLPLARATSGLHVEKEWHPRLTATTVRSHALHAGTINISDAR